MFGQIRRFVRYNLGEGLQKKSDDFASEVAAQIAAKADLKPVTEVPKVEVAKKEEDSPKVGCLRFDTLLDYSLPDFLQLAPPLLLFFTSLSRYSHANAES